jgi:SNF2 family DNA or RNA helicase
MTLTKTTSMPHQEKAIRLLDGRPYFGLFMEQGTGKTHVIIADAVRLFREGKINGLMVLAPNGVHDNWARNELPKHCPLDEEMRVAVWHSSDGAKAQDYFAWAVSAPPSCFSVVLANIEALRTPRFYAAIEQFLKRSFMLVIDESTVIKNPQAKQTKAAFLMAQKAAYRRILTGTPVTQGPLDVWGQCHFLSPSALPYRSYVSFKAEFAIEREMIFGQRRFKTVVGYRHLERLNECLREFTFRVTKDECLDLPDKIYQTRYVELTPEQKRAYASVVQECLLMIQDKMLTTTMVITQLLRLHQITLGYAITDDHSLVPIPCHRIAALMDEMDQNPGQAIIFCRFREDVRRVADSLSQCAEKPVYVEYHGGVGSRDREKAVADFQAGNARYFIATSAAARGLTLTAASTVIYYSQDFSLETRLQSEDRAHRIGQKKSVVYIDLVARDTVDEKIIKALQNKEDLAQKVTDPQAFATLINPV